MNRPTREELVWIGLLLALFVAMNFLTATVFPVPWQDEVSLVDPAANLYFGHGFTTTAYDWQPRTVFNSRHPLYSLVLGGWFELTGFGILPARAMNYVFTVLCALTIWLSVVRARLVPSSKYRIFLVALLLFGYFLSFPYRVGRMEPLLLWLCAVVFFLFTIESRPLRVTLMFALSLFFGFAAYQLMAFAGILAVIVALYRRREVLPEVLAICTGMVIGLGCAALFYASQGILHTAFGAIEHETSPLWTLVTTGTFDHRNRLPKDPSYTILLIVLGLVLVDQLRQRRFHYASILSWGTAVAIVIPLFFVSSAKFPTYYTWMVAVPLAIALCATLATMRVSPAIERVAQGGFVLACLAGLPFQLLAVSYDWIDRRPEPAQHLVAARLTKNDWVLADYQAYYGAKTSAGEVFLPSYVGLLTPAEKKRMNVLIGPTDTVARWRAILGGEWAVADPGMVPTRPTLIERVTGHDVDVALIHQKYDFAIYRRLSKD
jgi:hypothetical protein